MKIRYLVVVAAAAWTCGSLFAAAPVSTVDPTKTRDALEQWLELRKLMSEERHAWRSERELIRSSIEAIRRETERLDTELAASEGAGSAAKREHDKLTADNEGLKKATATVTAVVAEFEARVIELAEFFPQELNKRMAALLQRIPRGDTPTRASTGERLQTLIGVLTELEKFNRTVTVTSELQKLPNNETAQVDTIYLGLTIAFFVDGTNTYAGVLKPAKGGWQVVNDNALARPIRRALDVYRGEVLAEFVPLPVEIK